MTSSLLSDKSEGRVEGRTLDASVIIPTRNRSDSLRRVLDALARQDIDMRRIEVVVVVDGSSDDTLEVLQGERWPLRLRVIQQEQRGPGAARNRGTEAARGPVLIFLDDDVIPEPNLLAEHLRIRREAEPCVVIGRLAPDESPRVPGWWRWLEWQLDKQYKAMADGERRLDGHSLYSGNFSVNREAFRRVGGFDETLVNCEDTDLGLRLQEAGFSFRLNLSASARHCGHRDYRSWREMAYRGGRWDGALVLSFRYPFVWEALFTGYRARHTLVRVFGKLTLDRGMLLPWTLAVLGSAARLSRLLRLRFLERRLYGGIYNLLYWQGVCDELGSAHVLWRHLRRRQ